MKKRFLDRFRYPYLRKRLPENIAAGRKLMNQRAKSLYKDKPFLASRVSNRPSGLSLQLRKGTLQLHKRRLFGQKTPWWEIDTLERGSLVSALHSPSMALLKPLIRMGCGAPAPSQRTPSMSLLRMGGDQTTSIVAAEARGSEEKHPRELVGARIWRSVKHRKTASDHEDLQPLGVRVKRSSNKQSQKLVEREVTNGALGLRSLALHVEGQAIPTSLGNATAGSRSTALPSKHNSASDALGISAHQQQTTPSMALLRMGSMGCGKSHTAHAQQGQRRGGQPTPCVAKPSNPRVGQVWLSNPLKKGGDLIYSSFQVEEGLSRQQEKRPSPLLLQLMERTKLRIMYGNMANREVDRLIKRGLSIRGRMVDNLFKLLESRLDVFLYRIGFFATIPCARQWIHYGKVLINNKPYTSANYILQPGDVVSISTDQLIHLRRSLQERIRKLQVIRSEQLKTWTSPNELYESRKRVSQGDATQPVRRKNPNQFLVNFSELVGIQRQFRAPERGTPVSASRRLQAGHDAQRERLRWFNVKPSNAEISYRSLTAIYLYPPQQVLSTAIIDVEKTRSR